ncbi:MAG: aldo/keto reductase [Caldilineaceae bacterium]|nr:aldo/keto reductase [Caldilineaceae bacterium]
MLPTTPPRSSLALGGTVFGDQSDAGWLAVMQAALPNGINHFDTASGYGNGRSETLIGQYLRAEPGRREAIFLASKTTPTEATVPAMVAQIEQSLARLQTDVIDLYYIHWPRQGQDLRPWMEALEQARHQGKIRAVGVSNFSVEQMAQVATVGTIDAHQLCYNLFWRFAERAIIPYCQAHGIAVITYSSVAQGVLTGKFPRQPLLAADDKRPNTVLFDAPVWPHVYAGVEKLKEIAAAAQRPLHQLAMRWVLQQPGIDTAVVGARTPAQVQDNAQALAGDIPEPLLAQMTAISDEVIPHIPDTGNQYRYYP